MPKSPQQSEVGKTPRPPIVAVMGHIDHGKSTLLDYIRKTNVVESESGGITQHISAYEVVHESKSGEKKKITFLDTPGHEAFAAMRTHGATVADIAILVVAADDKLQAQAMEAYAQIKEAGIPFIVALNKVDKEGADTGQRRSELTEKGIYLEGFGGDVPHAEISAKSGQGIADLLDLLLLVAEMEELSGDAQKRAEGVVLESNVDPQKGISATLVIKDGTLHTGDFVMAGSAISPVRAIENFLGKNIDEAGPGAPVRVTGFDKAPETGSVFTTHGTKKQAEQGQHIETVCVPNEQKIIGSKDAPVVIPLIVRADTQGTLDAVLHELAKVPTEHVALKIIQCGLGDVAENDIKVAVGSTGPLVIGFRVRADAKAKVYADQQGVEIHTFAIIYNITDFLEVEIKKRTPEREVDRETGKVKVLKIFSATKKAQVIGGKVQEGYIEKGVRAKIMRRDSEIGSGVVRELQQQKTSASKVSEGNECGMMIEARAQIAEGDILVPFVVEKEQ